MPAPASLLLPDGQLTPVARLVLHTTTGVPMHLLDEVRVRPASANWLRAPWYRYDRGGAITLGRRIWFTRKWFQAPGYGDGSSLATWHWLEHLAHEVGHLPQAERYGLKLFGNVRYVLAFVGQYTWRAISFQGRVHDGAPLEIEADRGRQVLRALVGEQPVKHPLVRALHVGDDSGVERWCAEAGSLQRSIVDRVAAVPPFTDPR